MIDYIHKGGSVTMEKKLTEDERFDLMVQGILERLPDREVPTVENPGLIGYIFDIPNSENKEQLWYGFSD